MNKIDILAMGAHPDDVELIAGGTIAKMIDRGRTIVIADLTRGEIGTRGDGETRAREAAEAARILGVRERINLDMGDGRVEDSLENRIRVVETIRRFRPAIVMAHHWNDLHPDHCAAGNLVSHIMESAGIGKFPARGEPFRPNAFLFFMGRLPFTPDFVVDTTGFFEKKAAAVRAYRSQLHDRESSEPATHISRPDFLVRLEARDRHFGNLIDRTHGEPFVMKRTVPMDDPAAHFAPFEKM